MVKLSTVHLLLVIYIMKFRKIIWSGVPRVLRMAVIFSLLLFFDSCIDPINIDIEQDLGILIVEGAITTGPGPHKIRLSWSTRYGGIFDGTVRPANRALVTIRDSDGNNFKLTEETFRFPSPRPPSPNVGNPGQETLLTGVYTTTNDFSALLGESYSLLITTVQGIEYTSLPETVIQATDILELSAEFKKVPIGDKEFKTGIDVYATIQDAQEEKNFYMWKNTGLYKIRAFPSLRVCENQFGPEPLPCPKDCCEHCWVSETRADRSLHILSDNNINGNKTTIFTAFIEDDRARFTDKYLVRIELHTLNREAFQYFSLLKNQLSINGDIFDPPPATLRGNMINLSNPDENVLGYFRVSDISIDSMFLTRDMLLEPRLLLRFNDDCREYTYPNSTTEEPSYW